MKQARKLKFNEVRTTNQICFTTFSGQKNYLHLREFAHRVLATDKGTNFKLKPFDNNPIIAEMVAEASRIKNSKISSFEELEGFIFTTKLRSQLNKDYVNQELMIPKVVSFVKDIEVIDIDLIIGGGHVKEPVTPFDKVHYSY